MALLCPGTYSAVWVDLAFELSGILSSLLSSPKFHLSFPYSPCPLNFSLITFPVLPPQNICPLEFSSSIMFAAFIQAHHFCGVIEHFTILGDPAEYIRLVTLSRQIIKKGKKNLWEDLNLWMCVYWCSVLATQSLDLKIWSYLLGFFFHL